MTFATDTHAFIYHLTKQSGKIGRRARRVFDRVERGLDTLLVPFTVLEEVMLLSEAGKVRFPLSFRDLLISFIQADNFDLGINDPQLLLEAAAIPSIKDPYDRMIVAQARVLGLPLITGDDEIQESGLVRTVWDGKPSRKREIASGVSITDAYLGSEEGHRLLDVLADGARKRRLKEEAE